MTKEKLRKFLTAILVLWLISIVVIGVSYYFVIMPQKSHLKRLFIKVEREIETNLVASHANEKRANDLMDRKMEEAGMLFDEFLVNREDVTNFIFDFKRMADGEGIVDFTGSHDPSTAYSEIIGYEKIKEGSMRINFTGSYEQFVKMVNNFERYEPVIFVDRFDISRPMKQREGSVINMTLTYYVTK